MTYQEDARAIACRGVHAHLTIDGMVRINAYFKVTVSLYDESEVEHLSAVDVTVPGNEANKSNIHEFLYTFSLNCPCERA